DHFVGDHEYTMSIADLTHTLQISVGRGNYATAADHRLQNYGCHCLRPFQTNHTIDLVGADQRASRFAGAEFAAVVVWWSDVQEAGHERLERLFSKRLARRRKRAHGESVIGAMSRDDFIAVLAGMRAAAILPRHLECCLHRFGSAIQKKDAIQLLGEERSEARGQLRGRSVR